MQLARSTDWRQCGTSAALQSVTSCLAFRFEDKAPRREVYAAPIACRIKIAARSRLEMRRDLAGATPIGRGQLVGTAAEKIVRSARAPEQALLRGGMRL